MSRRGEPPLSRRERQIMDVLYSRGNATALDVVAALPDPPTKTAVRTLLSILERKGHVRHEQVGQTYVYRPTRNSEQAGPTALKRVLDVFFGGSLERAVAAHLGDAADDLSDNDLRRLAHLIRQARKDKKGP